MKNKLALLRKENGLSQERLAAILQVTRQTIISIEQRRYNPSLELAFRIAKTFDRRIEDIFIQSQERSEK